MVRIEILSTESSPIAPRNYNRTTIINILARSAAATQIQRVLRGVLMRRDYWKREEKETRQMETRSCSISCQVETDIVPRDQKACQVEILTDPPTPSSINNRRNKIMGICNSIKNKLDIHIDGCEVSSILKAMNLLGRREFEGLQKAVSIEQRQYYNQGHRTLYLLRLSNIMDFEKDLKNAWVELTQCAHQYPSIQMPRKRTRFNLNSESKRARDSVQGMVDVPKELILLLVENPGVLTYSNALVSNVLAMFGIKDEGSIQRRSDWTMIDLIRVHAKETGNSWECERCKIGIQILQNVARWEASINGDVNIQDVTGDQVQTNLRVTELLGEVEDLQTQLKKHVNINNLLPNKQQLSVAAREESKQGTPEAKTGSSTFNHEKSAKTTAHKQYQKKEAHQKAVYVERTGRSYASINTVDIKFTESKKTNKRSVERPHFIRATSSSQNKMSSQNHASIPTTRVKTNEKTMMSHQEKKQLHRSQYNLSTGVKPELNTTKRFNDILERLRFSE